MLTPSYSCHCIINSLALDRSPVNIRGVLPTNLSFLPPPMTGGGGLGIGGPPNGGPPNGGPLPGPPGGLANGPAGGPP
jgi:hypothetical protein